MNGSIKVTQTKVQHFDLPQDFTKFHLPVRMLVIGPSFSGKSHFFLQLVKYREQIFDKKFERIIYCFPEDLSEVNKGYIEALKNEFCSLEINYGLPKIETLGLKNQFCHSLLIIDDLFDQCSNSPEIVKFFKVFSHHFSLSLAIATQNLYENSKFGVTLTRNATTQIIFEDRSDTQYMNTLSKRIFSNGQFLSKAFEYISEHTQERYLAIDCSPPSLSKIPKKLMLRTQIFPLNDGKVRPIFLFFQTNYGAFVSLFLLLLFLPIYIATIRYCSKNMQVEKKIPKFSDLFFEKCCSNSEQIWLNLSDRIDLIHEKIDILANININRFGYLIEMYNDHILTCYEYLQDSLEAGVRKRMKILKSNNVFIPRKRCHFFKKSAFPKMSQKFCKEVSDFFSITETVLDFLDDQVFFNKREE